MASDIAFGSQNPGLSRNGARSRTNGSLKVISTPSYVHRVVVASPLRPRESQPKPATAISMLFASQLVPVTLISLPSHSPNSVALSLPTGGCKRSRRGVSAYVNYKKKPSYEVKFIQLVMHSVFRQKLLQLHLGLWLGFQKAAFLVVLGILISKTY